MENLTLKKRKGKERNISFDTKDRPAGNTSGKS
jgi:hypothetical protein